MSVLLFKTISTYGETYLTKSLYDFYAPIIGFESLKIYEWMVNHSVHNDNGDDNWMSQQYIESSLHLTYEQFSQKRRSLEAMGLVEVFYESKNMVSNTENKIFYRSDRYKYKLIPPLSKDDFFLNQRFVFLLKQKVTENDLQNILRKYESPNIFYEYKNITSPFEYVFGDILVDTSLKIDLNLLTKKLIEATNHNVRVNEKCINYINECISLFNPSFNEILNACINSLIDDNNGYCVSYYNLKTKLIDNNLLIKNAKANIKVNKDFEIFSSEKNIGEFENIINNYGGYKTEDYIASAIHQSLSDYEYNQIQISRKKYSLTDIFMNIVADYVLFKNKGIFSINYFISICKSIANYRIIGVDKLIEYLRLAYRNKLREYKSHTTYANNSKPNLYDLKNNKFISLNDSLNDNTFKLKTDLDIFDLPDSINESHNETKLN